MVIRPNPALHEEPRDQPTRIIPPALEESLFNWLERTGRFQSNEFDEQDHEIPEDLEDILGPETFAVEEEEDQFD